MSLYELMACVSDRYGPCLVDRYEVLVIKSKIIVSQCRYKNDREEIGHNIRMIYTVYS